MSSIQTGAAPLSLAQCPYHRTLQAAAAADAPVAGTPHDVVESQDEKRDLAPDHHWLDHAAQRTPVPSVPVGAWANAKHYEVVEAGAGMAALNLAWRLKGLDGSAPPEGATKAPEVAIFERTHHLGGRVHSMQVPGAQIPMDLGAMRFIPTQHLLVNNLATHFNIPTREFVVGGDNNLMAFRGVRLTSAQVAKDPTALPFNLAPNEKGKSVDQLIAMAIDAVIPGFQKMSDAQLDAAKRSTTLAITDPTTGKSTDVPLTQVGLQNILTHSLSREAIALVGDAVGYQSLMQNWDAGQAISAFAGDFKPGAEYRVPTAGMSAFPRALAGDLKKAGTPIFRETTLRQVDFDPTSRQFHLTFQDNKGKAVPVVADKLVLNMPRAPLADLVNDSPFLQTTPLDANLDKVKSNPMTRIYVTFDKAWWNDLGIQSGRSLTDSNIGQLYYYGQQGDTRPYVEVYADGGNSEYWEGLQNPGNPGVTTTLTATPQLAAELRRQLSELHGREVPVPTGIVYKRWADPFFGAAYHTWTPGSKPLDTTEQMIAPVDGLPLYVIGEAFSTNQGWIEGALETSEKALHKLGKAPVSLPAAG